MLHPRELEARVDDDVIALSGRLDADSMLAFDAAVEQAVSHGGGLTVDIRSVTVIDAAGIRGLQHARDLVGGRLALLDPCGRWTCLLRRARLDGHLITGSEP